MKVSRDTGDKEQVKSHAKKLKLAQEAELARFQKLLNTYEGREFVWRVLAQSSVYSPVYEGAELPMRMAWIDGKRHVGMWLHEQVFTASAEAYNLMRVEAEKRAEQAA